MTGGAGEKSVSLLRRGVSKGPSGGGALGPGKESLGRRTLKDSRVLES